MTKAVCFRPNSRQFSPTHPPSHPQTGGLVLLTLPSPSSHQEKGCDIPVVLRSRSWGCIVTQGEEVKVTERNRMET